ncbi:MAG TPA: HEAT repeat domain-containing protein, partial [Bacteroidales bacterium]|nr:HEAT repeat domain-containing protein [Bacteroidales bacterium]
MRKTLILSLSALMLMALAATTNGMTKARTTKVAVVTDQKTYEAIGNDIDAFTASMSLIGKEGVLIIDKWQHPDSLRAVLKHYYTTHKLEGAILVGDIPIAMIRDAQHMTTAFKMDQRADWKDSSVPSDRFYDDFDLRFEYLKQDADKPLLHYYSLTAESAQTIGCDIWTSRIKPPKIPETDKYSAISAYLKKAIEQKRKQPKKISNILVFAGHGYNSDS